jgi:prolyl-tRNA editing enzyme YbaK/EbsC (Cys-tRNA(Pro) deacylase)
VHIETVVDVTLGRYTTVWAAAGHSHSVFATHYDELIRITGGHPMDVA